MASDGGRRKDRGNAQSRHEAKSRMSTTRPPATHIALIENWFEELKAKVPVKR
jgi:hypothetical protein